MVVSITADKHIKKGTYRPHIPENLRALNLAAFEMVDFVLIDENSTPLENLDLLRPDFFAKGFEYTSSGLPAATEEESSVITAYGGEMIFTPGDVVYSSSKFISEFLPQVQLEKLLVLMDTHGITFEELIALVSDFKKISVHVVGDTIVDTYTRTSLIGGQTKTPTMSVHYEKHDNYVGGAGIVALHLRAAGASVVFSTVLGKDNLQNYVLGELDKGSIVTEPIIDKTRPTTNKNVIIAGGYRLLKIDTLDNRSIDNRVLFQIQGAIERNKTDIVVFSDFRHGIFNKFTVPKLTSAISRECFKVADSQVATRWGNILDFKNFDLITPNEREARFALGEQDANVSYLSNTLIEKTECKNLMLKLGARGMYCVQPEKSEVSQKAAGVASFIDSFAENVLDPVGSGDALLAYATLALYKSKSIVKSGIIGSMAAACECERDGNIPVKPEDVITKINKVKKLVEYK